ncbi:hypothetical protein [Rufibacter roseus]|uniref:Uncharacterized protein n=1 Tax=Rufibacter roseus TaxID=1567108 RepID=A0ABW2DNG2_9BACT|nr:hypothetical protein [Rufibacter roseus]
MLGTIKQIWNDTTKNAITGRYSMKRLMSWLAFFFIMFLSLADVVEMHLWPEQSFAVSKPNVEVLWVWVPIVVGGVGITAWSKIRNIQAGLTETNKDE